MWGVARLAGWCGLLLRWWLGLAEGPLRGTLPGCGGGPHLALACGCRLVHLNERPIESKGPVGGKGNRKGNDIR